MLDFVVTQIPCLFFSLFFTFFIKCFLLSTTGNKDRVERLLWQRKNPIPSFYPPRRQGKSHQPKSLWYETNRTPATQNMKSNSD